MYGHLNKDSYSSLQRKIFVAKSNDNLTHVFHSKYIYIEYVMYLYLYIE